MDALLFLLGVILIGHQLNKVFLYFQRTARSDQVIKEGPALEAKRLEERQEFLTWLKSRKMRDWDAIRAYGIDPKDLYRIYREIP